MQSFYYCVDGERAANGLEAYKHAATGGRFRRQHVCDQVGSRAGQCMYINNRITHSKQNDRKVTKLAYFRQRNL